METSLKGDALHLIQYTAETGNGLLVWMLAYHASQIFLEFFDRFQPVCQQVWIPQGVVQSGNGLVGKFPDILLKSVASLEFLLKPLLANGAY